MGQVLSPQDRECIRACLALNLDARMESWLLGLYLSILMCRGLTERSDATREDEASTAQMLGSI